MDLGAPPLRTFFSVTLPLIAPSVAAGFLLAFTLSLDDLVIASFNTGPGATTLPIRIYSQVRLGVTPEINAASTILIGSSRSASSRRRWRRNARGSARAAVTEPEAVGARAPRARPPEQEAARRPNAG